MKGEAIWPHDMTKCACYHRTHVDRLESSHSVLCMFRMDDWLPFSLILSFPTRHAILSTFEII